MTSQVIDPRRRLVENAAGPAERTGAVNANDGELP